MVAAGFAPDSEAALCMENDHTQGGLLIMSDKDRNHIESALKTKKLPMLQKCQEYIAYLLELGYDLLCVRSTTFPEVLDSSRFLEFIVVAINEAINRPGYCANKRTP
jgi:hypothetical protein